MNLTTPLKAVFFLSKKEIDTVLAFAYEIWSKDIKTAYDKRFELGY